MFFKKIQSINTIFSRWVLNKRLSEQEQNTQSRRMYRLALEQAYQNGFYTNNRKPKNEMEERLKVLFAEFQRAWGANPVFVYAILKPLTKYPKAFHQLVMESWGVAYYSVTFQAIHYWYCEEKGVRRLEDFNPTLTEDDMRDYLNAMVGHLFNRYAVPEVMLEVWWTWNWFDAEEMSEKTGFKQVSEAMSISRNVLFHWYFTVAEGNNLRLSPYLPVQLSKQAAFWFSNAPDDLSLLQTFYWAKAKARGLSDNAAHGVANNCSVFESNPSVFDQICDCIIKSKEEDSEKINTFICFVAMVKFGENTDKFAYFGANLIPDLSLKGRTIASILRLRAEFQRALGAQNKEASTPLVAWKNAYDTETICIQFLDENYLLKLTYSDSKVKNFDLFNDNDVYLNQLSFALGKDWKGELLFRTQLYTVLSKRDFPSVKNIEDCFKGEANGQAFEIVRLSSYQDLVEEALHMEHCVASYGSECNVGDTSIWSVRLLDGDTEKNRLTTIQLTNYRIVQASAKLNAEPDDVTLDILRNWKEAVLTPFASKCSDECLICSCAA